MLKITEYFVLFSFFVFLVSCGPCSDRLGAKQNTVLKRHLPGDPMMLQKSLDMFEKKFESIKTMPWDYKYRRHDNRIDWDAAKRLETQDSGHTNEYSKKNTGWDKGNLSRTNFAPKEQRARGLNIQRTGRKYQSEEFDEK